MNEPEIYCIRVEGHLEDEWSAWLGDMAIERAQDGTTTLTGPVADQSALHGLLLKIHNMGLPLIACQRVSERTKICRSGDISTSF